MITCIDFQAATVFQRFIMINISPCAMFLLIAAISVLSSCALPIKAASGHQASADDCDVVTWESWKTEHGKTYSSKLEDAQRCLVFM
jgi:hypothetical protein